MLALKIKPYFILVKFLPWIFRTQTCLSEYTMDFVLSRRTKLCLDIIVYHAGVAGKLGCLKLKKCGLLCMLMNFATIYTFCWC